MNDAVFREQKTSAAHMITRESGIRKIQRFFTLATCLSQRETVRSIGISSILIVSQVIFR